MFLSPCLSLVTAVNVNTSALSYRGGSVIFTNNSKLSTDTVSMVMRGSWWAGEMKDYFHNVMGVSQPDPLKGRQF